MRKTFLLSLLLIAALVLGACSAQPAQVGTEPPDSGTVTPGSGVGDVTLTTETPSVGAGETTATPLATTEADIVTVTDTPQTGTGDTTQVTNTPQASAGGGDTSGTTTGTASQYARLSSLLGQTVAASDNEQAGVLRGFVFNRAVLSEDTAASMNAFGNPTISYGILDIVDETGANTTGGDAAQATSTPQATNTPLAASGANAQATNTPAPNEVPQGDANQDQAQSQSTILNDFVMVPFEAFDLSGDLANGLAVNMDEAALAAAPHFSKDAPPDVASANWDVTTNEYWASQGMGVPVTGAQDPATATAPFLYMGDAKDLSVRDNTGQAFASVSDFLVNTSTGVVEYAIVTGAALNNQFYAVPAGFLTWQIGDQGAVATDQTQTTFDVPYDLTLTVPVDQLAQSPAIPSLDSLIQNNPELLTTVLDFWTNFQDSTK